MCARQIRLGKQILLNCGMKLPKFRFASTFWSLNLVYLVIPRDSFLNLHYLANFAPGTSNDPEENETPILKQQLFCTYHYCKKC